MKNKVVYLTQWKAKDNTKEYPHGYGFIPLVVEFPQDKDSAWVAQICRENLSNDEFECYAVVPAPLIDGMVGILGEVPEGEPNYEAMALTAINNGLYTSLGEAMKEIERLKTVKQNI